MGKTHVIGPDPRKSRVAQRNLRCKLRGRPRRQRTGWEPPDGWTNFDRLCMSAKRKELATFYNVPAYTIDAAIERRANCGFKQFRDRLLAERGRAMLESWTPTQVAQWIETGIMPVLQAEEHQ